MLDDLCFLMLNHSITAIAIKSWPFRVALTWRFLRCSGERRRQSSGWLPPNWSRPPPQSDRSPGSWGRQLRGEFRICSNSSTVASVHRLYAWAHTSQTPFRSARSWQQDLVAVAKIQIDKWDNEASTGFFQFELLYLPSLCAAPPSVTVFTKMPSFSRPMSAPAPIPMILMPRPSPSGGEWGMPDQLLLYCSCSPCLPGFGQFDLLYCHYESSVGPPLALIPCSCQHHWDSNVW